MFQLHKVLDGCCKVQHAFQHSLAGAASGKCTGLCDSSPSTSSGAVKSAQGGDRSEMSSRWNGARRRVDPGQEGIFGSSTCCSGVSPPLTSWPKPGLLVDLSQRPLNESLQRIGVDSHQYGTVSKTLLHDGGNTVS